MRRLISKVIHRFLGAQGGATSIEYAVIACGIAGAIIAIVTALGGSVGSMWARAAAIF